MPIKEIVLYLIVAFSALFILGYSVHMFIGGLVSPEMERAITYGVCGIGLLVIGFMAWDIKKRRKG